MTVRRTALSAIPALVFLLLSVWAQRTGNWAFLIDTARPDVPFLDLSQVTATASCAMEGNWSIASPTCDPLGRGYNYPSAWALGFAALGLGFESTLPVGYLLIALTAVALWLVGWWTLGTSARLVPAIGVTAAAASPAVMLLAERGNIDTLVFLLTVLAAGFATYGRGVGSAIFISFAAVLKVFPAAGLGVLAMRGVNRRWSLIVAATILTVGGAMLVYDIPYITSRTPQGFGTAFGAAAAPALYAAYAGFDHTSVLWRIVGVMVFTGVTTVMYLLVRRPTTTVGGLWRDVVDSCDSRPAASALLLASGGSLVGAYLMGVSSDYRLVFAIPVIAVLLSLFPVRINPLPSVIAIGLLVTMWLSFDSLTAFAIKGFVGMFVFPVVGLLVVQILMRNVRAEKSGLGTFV